MSPSLKYLMVSSIAARNASSDPMSLTATLGVEWACVLLVMCGLAPDADRESYGHAGIRAPQEDQDSQALPEPARADHGTPRGPPAPSRDVMSSDHDGTHEDTAQRSGYESKPGEAIDPGHNTASVCRLRLAQWPASAQLRPVPTDTARGTRSEAAPAIAAQPRSRVGSNSPGATSKTSCSCTCRSIRDRSPAAVSELSTASMATLITSAADP